MAHRLATEAVGMAQPYRWRPWSAQHLHWSFEDPLRATDSEEERLQMFRRIRDEIATRLRAWLAERPV